MSTTNGLIAPGARLVVVSPHLDDGVLSLGASMLRWARAGAQVELLTVFGCDPASTAPTRGWDCRAGFRTEGEAARARRDEDRRACAVLGAAPVWLPFGSVDYERHGDEVTVREAVVAVLDRADTTLLPGSPLSHPDHAWLVRLLAGGALPVRRLGLYAEQPYSQRAGSEPGLPEWLAEAVGGSLSFERLPASIRDRLAKWSAIRRYGSQLPLLAMRRSPRRGPHMLAFGAETVAWADDRAI